MSTPLQPEAPPPSDVPASPDPVAPNDAPPVPPDTEPSSPIEEPSTPQPVGDPVPAVPPMLV